VAAQPIAVTVLYRAQPKRRDRTRQELEELVAAAAVEPACLGMSLHENADDSTQFLLYERWTDREIYFGAHMDTPHLQAFIRRAPDFLTGPPEITAWQLLGDVGEARRAPTQRGRHG
jgi:quinol monooxygenase YgiN